MVNSKPQQFKKQPNCLNNLNFLLQQCGYAGSANSAFTDWPCETMRDYNRAYQATRVSIRHYSAANCCDRQSTYLVFDTLLSATQMHIFGA